jgi:hypothetical protein
VPALMGLPSLCLALPAAPAPPCSLYPCLVCLRPALSAWPCCLCLPPLSARPCPLWLPRPAPSDGPPLALPLQAGQRLVVVSGSTAALDAIHCLLAAPRGCAGRQGRRGGCYNDGSRLPGKLLAIRRPSPVFQTLS